MGAETLLLEAGKSTELQSVLQTVAECEADGEAKFSPTTCRAIGKMIVCRTYAPAILELSHLIVAAAQLEDMPARYEYLFWDNARASTAHFHSYFNRHAPAPDLLHVQTNEITLHYSDGTFSIQFSRMPVLCALMEFLLTALGYRDIDELLSLMQERQVNKKAVSLQANALSRLLYTYLRAHLPTAQSQRKYRKILDYCSDDISRIDDKLVLNFWQDASLDEDKNVDFKTYEGTFLSIVRVIQAVEGAQELRGLQQTRSIGNDHEAGEIDPDLLSRTLETIDLPRSALERLGEAPMDQIKFLNKQETQRLQNMVRSGKLSLRLPLSLLRSDLYSASQAQLTQALRRHAKPDEIRDLIKNGPPKNYQEHQEDLTQLRQHLDKAVHASLHSLSAARNHNALLLLLKLAPHVDFAPLAQHFPQEQITDNVIALPGVKLAQHFLALLQDEESVGPEIASIMKRAQQSHHALTRKGFREDVQEDGEIATALCEGAQILLEIARDMDAFMKKLNTLLPSEQDWKRLEEDDRQTFAHQFTQIYGRQS